MNFKATLLKTAFDKSQFPAESLPEIAVAGRSNVGKSSLINRLVGNRIAHVGSKPGKTRSINFYRIEGDNPFILVDLPGYGFASRSKSERAAWSRLIESYVINRNSLALVISLIDFRHGLLKNDKILQEWIKDLDIPLLTVFTKIDKIARGKRKGLLHTYIRKGLYSLEVPFLTSASDNDGTEDLQNFLISFVSDLS